MKKRPSFPAQLDVGKPQPAPKTLLGATRIVTTPKTSAQAHAPVMQSPSGVGLDSSTVRARMVQKLADQGIDDDGVLQAMGRVERHRFVDSALVNQAYEEIMQSGEPMSLFVSLSPVALPWVHAKMEAIAAAQGLLNLAIEISNLTNTQ